MLPYVRLHVRTHFAADGDHELCDGHRVVDVHRLDAVVHRLDAQHALLLLVLQQILQAATQPIRARAVYMASQSASAACVVKSYMMTSL